MKRLFFTCMAFVLFACKHEDLSNNAIINVNKVTDTMVILNKWEVLGPFSSNNADNFKDTDNLKLFGFREESISFQDFQKITKYKAKDTSLLDSCFALKFHQSGKLPLDFSKFYKVNKEKYKGNVYCACLLVCKKEIQTRLHFSSSAGEKIWLNGKLICAVNYMKPSYSYEQFIPVSLKKGPNFLLVKISKSFSGWEMYARLENESETAMKRHFGLHSGYILNGTIIQYDTIKLDSNFPPCNGRITISDNNNKILFSDTTFRNKRWSRCITSFKSGMYHVSFKTGTISLKQDFYRGNLHDSLPKIIKILQSFKISGRTKDNVDALIFRYNHLLTHTYPSDPKYVTLFIQLTNVHNDLQKGYDPFHHTAGSFIRSYISDIDNSRQYYILHVPSTYDNNKPSALASNVPATVYDGYPYLESFRVGNSKLINFFQDLAEKYNIMVVEPGSRRYKQPNYNTIEEAEFFNILTDIRKDYTVDMKRLYLMGTCSGGNEALKLTVQFPDCFAAVGLIAPEVIYPNESKNSSIPFIRNIISTPIFDYHSLIDRHIDVKRSELLNKIAKEQHFKNYKFYRLSNEFPKYHVDDFFDDALEFCTKYTLNVSPKEIDFTTPHIMYNKSFWITLNGINSPDTAHIYARIKRNKLTIEKKNIVSYTIDLKTLPYQKDKPLRIIDNEAEVFNGIPQTENLFIGKPLATKPVKNSQIAGPFSHVFSEKFIVVKGTSGSKVEKTHLSALADTINKYWNVRYFTSCISKNDVEITEKDIAESNLILLGNYQSNFLLNKLKDKLPVKINNTGISINKTVISGNKLCFYMIYPNPLNKTKYVAIIGYNNPDYISTGSETESFDDISNYGWYDYKVWDNTSSKELSSGYFNSKWEL